jgi:hypothetical protein
VLPETWTLLNRSTDECMVSRNVDGRVTIWQLRLSTRGWRVYEIMFSRPNAGCNGVLERHKYFQENGSGIPTHVQCQHGLGGCWDRSAHASGIRLTVSRIDSILTEYAIGERS